MDRMKMAQRLRDLRKTTGKSQETVARDIGVSFSSYTKYEIGDRVPRDEIKAKIADYYGKSVQSIFFS